MENRMSIRVHVSMNLSVNSVITSPRIVGFLPTPVFVILRSKGESAIPSPRTLGQGNTEAVAGRAVLISVFAIRRSLGMSVITSPRTHGQGNAEVETGTRLKGAGGKRGHLEARSGWCPGPNLQ